MISFETKEKLRKKATRSNEAGMKKKRFVSKEWTK
jgi:hypothetical protein